MKRYIQVGICVCLVLLVVAFIFWNSAQPVAVSAQASTSVKEQISAVVDQSNIQNAKSVKRAVSWYTRKAAHAVEFVALGMTLFLTAVVIHKKLRLQAIWNILSLSLGIGVVDEAIQILSDRGPKVQDVLLDFCSATAAIALCGILYYGIRFFRRRRKKTVA